MRIRSSSSPIWDLPAIVHSGAYFHRFGLSHFPQIHKWRTRKIQLHLYKFFFIRHCNFRGIVWDFESCGGTIANFKENLNKIALDVHDDDDEILREYATGITANGDNSAVSGRRSSYGSASSKSGIGSPLANGIDHASLPEVILFLCFSLKDALRCEYLSFLRI